MPLLPRAERLDLSFPVSFHDENGIAEGNCLNVSESGMLARFRRPVEVWTEGELRGNLGELRLVLRVRVVRSLEQVVAMAFRFRSEQEREMVRTMVTFALKHTSLAGGRPPF